MPSYSLIWLADVLEGAGLKVVEQPGWKTRGRGDVSPIKGIICHHTAAPPPKNAPSLGIVTNGRPDLSGPLSQLVLGRDGTYYVVAAGAANHAGKGEWKGCINANKQMIGIEAENNGIGEVWPEVQMDAYRRGCAAMLAHLKLPVIMCAGHKEYALPRGRKIDPAFDVKNPKTDMIKFREEVAAIMKQPAGDKLPDEPASDNPKVKVVGVAPDTLTFRDAPNGEDIGELPEGLVVEKVGEDGKWIEVVTPWTKSRGWVAERFTAAA